MATVKRSNSSLCTGTYILLWMLVCLFQHCSQPGGKGGAAGQIIIELHYAGNIRNVHENNNDEILFYSSLMQPGAGADEQRVVGRHDRKRNCLRWVLHSNAPLVIRHGLGWIPMACPGDSMILTFDGNNLSYAGTGSEKLLLWSEIVATEKICPKPTKYSFAVSSLDDFLKWNDYVDRKLNLQIQILDKYKPHLKPFEYNHLKSCIVSSIEEHRLYAFRSLKKVSVKDISMHVSSSDLVNIWDSTQARPMRKWLTSLPYYYGSLDYMYNFIDMHVQRASGFRIRTNSPVSKEDGIYINYINASRYFTGLLRERLLAYIICKIAVPKIGLDHPATRRMLNDYYTQKGFPKYKQWVRDFCDRQ